MRANISSVFCIMAMGLIAFVTTPCRAQEQNKPSLAVLTIDSRIGIVQDAQTVSNIVRLELEKTGRYAVADRYEVAEVAKKDQIDLNTCFSTSCLVGAGKALGVAKMVGGSVELLGDKIVINLRLIDVASGKVEKSDATEYLNLPELQKMIQISVEKLVGLQPNKNMVNQLVHYDLPVESPRNTLRLNGPRIGFTSALGDAGRVLVAPTAKGGFGMYPVSFVFGWQQEYQYLSSGGFQALIENVFLVSGIESGRFIPNYAPLLGFRFGHGAWEFALGPTFRFVKKADGFFDTNGLIGEKNDWHLEGEMPIGSNYEVVRRLDSRGGVYMSTGLVVAFGKTFRSGYLNIPLNLYVAPRRDGTTIGATFGFNVQRKEKRSKSSDR